MNRKLILCLALGLSGGFLGVQNSLPQDIAQDAVLQQTTNSTSLTLSISAAPTASDSILTFPAEVIFKNDGSLPLKICTKFQHIDAGTTVYLDTDTWYCDSPTRELIAASVKQVAPGQSLIIPMHFNAGEWNLQPGSNSICLRVIYKANCDTNEIYFDQNKVINMWRGQIESTPFIVHVLKR